MHLKPLIGHTEKELIEIVTELGMQPFVGKQVARWLYHSRITSIDDMVNIAKVNRARLASQYCIGMSAPIGVATSTDGTKKYLFSVGENDVETVYIPDEDRHTLCVSSQAGCRMGCRFCATGNMGFKQNLSAGEIINQVLSIEESKRITNIVFMGMGEPLDNCDEVLKALSILTSDYGLAMSPRRITVSTVGVLPKLEYFLENTKCHIAVSLHTPFAEERNEMMPINKAYPLLKIVELLHERNEDKNRDITFEYILFKGLNDSMRHANTLAKMVGKIHCKVNLLFYNTLPDSPFVRPSLTEVKRFRDWLNKKGIVATIRRSRGQDIDAACGMLSQKTNK